MAITRRTYTPAEQIALTTQVEGRCPLCGKDLFYVKRGKQQKAFEIAHIYPLNPKPEELVELAGVERLCSDVNHPDNLLPFCPSCHTRFDKPRSVSEYLELVAIKKNLLARAEQRRLFGEYPLESDITRILAGLHSALPIDGAQMALSYDVKSLADKLHAEFPMPTRQKITHAVTDYYPFIKDAFGELERSVPSCSALIYSQVKVFYLKQKNLGISQAATYRNIVEWIRDKTSPATTEAPEIVAAFFIQNCEVFE